MKNLIKYTKHRNVTIKQEAYSKEGIIYVLTGVKETEYFSEKPNLHNNLEELCEEELNDAFIHVDMFLDNLTTLKKLGFE